MNLILFSIMSLAKAIQFNSLAAQLTPIETASFIKDAADSNPQMIMNALSTHFMHKQPIKDNVNYHAQCIVALSTIIQLREDEPHEQSWTKLDALPPGVIGACATYLDQKSYGRLSAVNRAMYSECNSPNLLQELSVRYKSPSDHQLLDFSDFPFAKKLTLVVDLVDAEIDKIVLNAPRMRVIASQIANMPVLQSLDLSEANAEFVGIIANHETTNQRTQSLSVAHWESDDAAFDRFIAAFSKFKHLQCLIMSFHENSGAINDLVLNLFIETCNNLRALDFYDGGTGIQQSVLQTIGHKLQYLKLHDIAYQMPSKMEIDFANLRELEQECDRKSFDAVFCTATNLEKVYLTGLHGLGLIDQTLADCERLRYLEITGSATRDLSMERILRRIKRQICNTELILSHRNTFKIRIVASLWNEELCSNALYRITNALTVKAIDQWMIILDLRFVEEENRESFIQKLRTKLEAEIVVLQDSRAFVETATIMITNPKCTICGCKESWLVNK